MKSRPIHVLQLGSGNYLYGAERWILALTRYLNTDIIRTTVASIKDGPDCPTALIDEAKQRGLNTHLIDAPGRLSIKGIQELAAFSMSSQVDIVHSHGYKPDLYALLGRKFGGYKLLMTPHGWSYKPDLKEVFYEFINKIAFLFCDAVAPLSNELNDSLLPRIFDRQVVELIPNAIDMDEIDKVKPKFLPYICNGREFIIGFIGRLIPLKGLNLLIKALEDLPISAWKCLIIGQGECESQLKSQVASLNLGDRIHFLGYREDRLALLKRFNLFVLPSYSEGIPRCVMEAMASGVPVLGSDIPGIRQLIRPNQTGWLFESGDSQSLKKILCQIYQQRNQLDGITKQARQLISERHSGTRLARDYERLYKQLLGHAQ